MDRTRAAHQQAISRHKVKLLKNLTVDATFLAYFEQERMMTTKEKQSIKACTTSTDKADAFLDIIGTKGERAFDVMVRALEDTCQHDLADGLLSSRNSFTTDQRKPPVSMRDGTMKGRTSSVQVQPSFSLHGYEIMIKEGQHYCMDGDHYVELKHGTEFTVFVQNHNDHNCRFNMTMDGINQGTWKIKSQRTMTTDCPAKLRNKFIFLRPKYAPEKSGIKGKRSTNGLVECTFMAEEGAPEIEFVLNMPLHSPLCKTRKFCLFTKATTQDLFQAAMELGPQLMATPTGTHTPDMSDPVIVIWEEKEQEALPKAVVDGSEQIDLKTIAGEYSIQYISILPRAPPRIKLVSVGGREVTLPSGSHTISELYDVLRNQQNRLHVDVRKAYLFAVSGNISRRVAEVSSLSHDTRPIWCLLTEVEIAESAGGEHISDQCLRLIVYDGEELPVTETDGVEEDGESTVEGMRAGAVALYGTTKRKFRVVPKLKIDESKNVYLNFRLVAREGDEIDDSYDKDDIVPLSLLSRKTKVPKQVPD